MINQDELIADLRDAGISPMFLHREDNIKFFTKFAELTLKRASLSANEQDSWISVDDRLPELIENGNWKKSPRCVVYIRFSGRSYEAFGELSSYLETEAKWKIEGHNGDWNDRVTHWMPLPAPPKDKP